MQRFRNILVGVDLSHADRLAASELGAPTREAVDRAVWLAELTSARVTFFAVLDLSPQTEHLIEADTEHLSRNVEDAAREVLADLADQAKQRNVQAEIAVALGTPWEAIIRQVQRGGHDLVVVGTRDRGGLTRLLFGSTAMKLIHNCPCPVWVTRPDPTPETLNILVASDLTEVSQDALNFVVSGAQVIDAKIHLLHSVQFPLTKWLRHSGVVDDEVQEYRKRVKAEAEQALNEQLSQTDYRTLTHGVKVHIAESPPEVAILEAIDEHEIDLLVLGTVARSGIPGVLIGNTAERLLPQVPCSVLAVKPRGFVSPIAAD